MAPISDWTHTPAPWSCGMTAWLWFFLYIHGHDPHSGQHCTAPATSFKCSISHGGCLSHDIAGKPHMSSSPYKRWPALRSRNPLLIRTGLSKWTTQRRGEASFCFGRNTYTKLFSCISPLTDHLRTSISVSDLLSFYNFCLHDKLQIYHCYCRELLLRINIVNLEYMYWKIKLNLLASNTC